MLARAAISAIRKDKLKITMLSIISVIVALLLWQAIVSFGLVDTRFLAGQVEVIQRIIEKFTVEKPDGNLIFNHIWPVSRWYGSVLFSVLF